MGYNLSIKFESDFAPLNFCIYNESQDLIDQIYDLKSPAFLVLSNWNVIVLIGI